MRVLLDENVDELLKGLFAPEIEVLTVRERGWQGKANGELLRAAEREFNALVTMDRSLEYQQNLRVLDLGIVVLRAHSNAYPVVAPLMPQVNEVLRSIQPGQVIHIRP
jgi:predicted nuclease of predicted toxin-antitoxin system